MGVYPVLIDSLVRMASDLEKYNHIKQKKTTPESDGFVEFMYSNSELQIPDFDTNAAWDNVSAHISSKERNNFSWLKIAASIALVCSFAMVVYFISIKDSEVIQVVAKGQRVSVTFPDGSTGVLNAHTTVTYPRQFGDIREITLEGEAYFDIIKNHKPFIIDADHVDVKVLGTAFNLITKPNEVKLYVDRGTVAFAKEGKETKVTAGIEAVFNRSTNEVAIKETPSPNIMSWRNGSFEFDNTPLREVTKQLGEYYGVDFKVSKKSLKSCRISASIKNQSLEEALSLIETILDVNAKLKGKTVKISGKGC